MKTLNVISISSLSFDEYDLEWKVRATFKAAGEKPHSHIVSMSRALGDGQTEDAIRETCTRAVLVAAGRYMLGTLTGESSATDFYDKRDLDDLTEGERSVLTGDAE